MSIVTLFLDIKSFAVGPTLSKGKLLRFSESPSVSTVMVKTWAGMFSPPCKSICSKMYFKLIQLDKVVTKLNHKIHSKQIDIIVTSNHIIRTQPTHTSSGHQFSPREEDGNDSKPSTANHKLEILGYHCSA